MVGSRKESPRDAIFFDIRDDQLVPDEEGMILPDIGAAQEEATRTVYTENLIRVDDVMETPKLAE
jgi:hypothetical protein